MTGPTWATRWSCTTDARCAVVISAEHRGRAGTEGFRPAFLRSCLWPRWCSGRRLILLWGRAAWCTRGRRPAREIATREPDGSECSISKPGQAPPPHMGAAARPRLEARPGPAAAHGRSFFRSPPCLGGALGAIAGVFALRDETDSTFAGASLQWNETAITIAGDERPFSGQFQPAKVLAVSMGRAAWRAKVLAVSKLVRHRILCAQKFAPHLPFLPWCPKKFALQAQNG